MMYGYYGNCNGGFWPLEIIGNLVGILILVLVIVFIVRIIRGVKHGNWSSWRGNSAENLLKERFVKGEINKDEYEEKLKVIRG